MKSCGTTTLVLSGVVVVLARVIWIISSFVIGTSPIN